MAQYEQHFSICVYSTLVALGVAVVAMVPAWPCWKSHQLPFQKYEPSNLWCPAKGPSAAEAANKPTADDKKT